MKRLLKIPSVDPSASPGAPLTVHIQFPVRGALIDQSPQPDPLGHYGHTFHLPVLGKVAEAN